MHTISLPFAYHVLTISLPFAPCPELTASCEGSRLGVAAVCIPYPYHLFTMPLQFPYHLLHAQNRQPGARGTVFGLLLFANNLLTNCAPCPGASKCSWFLFGIAGGPEHVFKHVPKALRDHGPRFALQKKVQNKDGIHSTHSGCSVSRGLFETFFFSNGNLGSQTWRN